ncbi:MAG: hypothetical protein ACSHXI_17810 [Hoeflea sp.]|uniref:hypothetical protein n=1 Tax=Hoeflea sp. TaxID=1940281 RepID=UPI003EF54282
MALKDFRDFFGEFIALVGAAVATAALVLITALSGLIPPWPEAIVQITAILQLAILMFVYQFYKRSSKKIIDKRMKLFLVYTILFCVLYLSAYSLLVYEVPDETKDLRGLFCTAEAMLVYIDSCPIFSEEQIADAGFIPRKLWTPLGILLSRLILLLSWGAFFGFLVSLFATFVVYQRRT